MNCQKCKSWEEMYDRCENEKRAMAAEKDGADEVIKNLKAHVAQLQEIIKDHTRQWAKAKEVLRASDRRSNAALCDPAHGDAGKPENL